MRNTFYTWGEFLQFVSTAKPVGRSRDSRGVSSTDVQFTGTQNFEEAMKLAVNGWPEGEKKAREFADALFIKVASLVEREEVVHDVVGTALDIGAYLNGDPECWTRQESHIVDGNAPKIYRIVYHCGCSGSVSKDVISAKGAAIAALIRSLEFSGHRAEVWALAKCITSDRSQKYSANPDHETRVQVKSADQDLDFGRLAFALGHPSMLRRFGAACLEADPVIFDTFNYGLSVECAVAERGDIYIGRSLASEPDWKTTASAIRWILATLKEQGVSVREG